MSEFLALVGLAALVIAGIGIGGGVTSYLDARRQGIARSRLSARAQRYRAHLCIADRCRLAGGKPCEDRRRRRAGPLLGMALELLASSGVIVDPGAILWRCPMLVALVFAAPPLLRARHFPQWH